jgi:tryptophanyl-tRNA synthetase
MRSLFKLALLIAALGTMFGCAHNYYNIPQETLEKKVKTIGVAPIFTDEESDIRHPDKQAIVSLVKAYNAKNEKEKKIHQAVHQFFMDLKAENPAEAALLVLHIFRNGQDWDKLKELKAKVTSLMNTKT